MYTTLCDYIYSILILLQQGLIWTLCVSGITYINVYIKSVISSHNRKILHLPINNQVWACNCLNKTGFPLKEKCLSENTIYQVDTSSENFQTKIYYGISEIKFKTRYSNHKKSFNQKKDKNETQLSSELWKIKASKEEPVLAWKILRQYQPYNVNTKRWLLCLNENLQIAIYRGNNRLNKQTEIISKCRHRNKYILTKLQQHGLKRNMKSWSFLKFLIFLELVTIWFTAAVKQINRNSIYFNKF